MGKQIAVIGDEIIGEAAVAGVSGELRLFAKILVSASAVTAFAAGRAQPRDADPLAERPARRAVADRVHRADDFVAGHEGKLGAGKVTVDDVKIRPADGAGVHPDAELSFTGARDRHRFQRQPCARLPQHHCPHHVRHGAGIRLSSEALPAFR